MDEHIENFNKEIGNIRQEEGNVHSDPESLRKFQRRGTQRNPPRNITIKMSKAKDKGRILNVARRKKKKTLTYKGFPMRLLPSGILQLERNGTIYLKC